MKRPRLVATVRVKNEAWILETWLKRTCEFVDGIIAINDASTDDSPRILRSCPKTVALIDNPPGGTWDQFRDRNRLLDEARRVDADWVHVIDPDEIMDARLSERIDELLSQQDVGRYYFREITLWRSTRHYRVDQPEKYHRSTGTNQLLRLTPGLRWVVPARFDWKRRLFRWATTGRWQPVPRAGSETLVGVTGRTMELHDLVRLHYHFVNWNRAWFMHLRYAAREAIQMKKRPTELSDVVRWATDRLDESGLQVQEVQSEWGVLDVDLNGRFVPSQWV